MPDSRMMVFAGNANPQLAEAITRYLNIPLGKAIVGHFSDDEIMVEILESVRGRDIFIIQPTCSPVNNNLMELLVMVDALRRASAHRITAVVPYFGYARQDRRPRSARVPVTAQVVASMLTHSGIDGILTVDLHADQIQGFFGMPVDNVYASPVLLGDIWRQKYKDLIVVSPDVGGVVRARALAKQLDDADLAIIDKRRPKPNEAKVMNIIGDVEGRTCVLVDDIVDSAGTLCNAAEALMDVGAKRVFAYVTHGVLSGGAVARVTSSALEHLSVTDSIASTDAMRHARNIKTIPIAPLLGEAIRRISEETSVSSLFE